MKHFITLLSVSILIIGFSACSANTPGPAEKISTSLRIVPGAEYVDSYIPLLKGKRVCLLSNQTGMITEKRHVLDTMLSLGVNVTCVMSPEHGFRGTADAGEMVASSVDEATGVPIRSLYDGKGGYPTDETMEMFDVLVFDLQDVGCRFYTYVTSMAKVMKCCALHEKKMIILDQSST